MSSIDNALRFHRTALSLRAARQVLLASNIANADTPNYKARDIDFASALQGALLGSTVPLPWAATAPGHFSGTSGETVPGPPMMYRGVLQPAADGNTVDMDVESAQFTDNALHYEASLSFAGSTVKNVLTALQG
jgi:flagellar basal-body rod protein FlgB